VKSIDIARLVSSAIPARMAVASTGPLLSPAGSMRIVSSPAGGSVSRTPAKLGTEPVKTGRFQPAYLPLVELTPGIVTSDPRGRSLVSQWSGALPVFESVTCSVVVAP
jgi:hypothetical protein